MQGSSTEHVGDLHFAQRRAQGFESLHGLQLEDRKPFVRRVVRPRARRNALHSGDAAVHAPTSDVHEGEVGERDDPDHRGLGLIGQGLGLTQWNGETLEYDDFGSLERRTSLDAETTFTYDVWGNLHEVQTTDSDTGSQTTITYGTDGHNRRISKSVDGALRWKALYRSSLQPAAWIKTNDDGTQEVTHFVYATGRNSPDLMIRDSRVYWLIVDHVGSVRRVVDVSTGAELQQIDYDAWGQITNEVGAGFQPFAFGGGILDRDTGLVRFGARDYDPRLGRWTTKDPLRFDGRSTNLYQYVNGDPVNFVDPGGENPIVAGLMVILGMGAAAPSDTAELPADIIGMGLSVLPLKGLGYPSRAVLRSRGLLLVVQPGTPLMRQIVNDLSGVTAVADSVAAGISAGTIRGHLLNAAGFRHAAKRAGIGWFVVD